MARRLFLNSKGGTAEGFVKVELKSRLFELALNIMMRMMAGKRYYGNDGGVSEEARQFREMVVELFSLSGTSNLGNFLPMLMWVDFQGVRKRSARLQKKRDEFMQRLIDELRKGSMEIIKQEKEDENKKKNMIGDLLLMQKTDPEYYTDQTIKALCLVSKCLFLSSVDRCRLGHRWLTCNQRPLWGIGLSNFMPFLNFAEEILIMTFSADLD